MKKEIRKTVRENVSRETKIKRDGGRMGVKTIERELADEIIALLKKSPLKEVDVIMADIIITALLEKMNICMVTETEQIEVVPSKEITEPDGTKNALDNMIFWARMYLRSKKNPEAIHRFGFDEVEKEILEAEDVYKKMP